MTRSGDPAGAELLRGRLEAYARYAALLEQQEAAADEGDLDRISQLDTRLDALERAIDALPTPRSAGPALDREAARLRDAVQEVLERAARTQARVARKLREHRDLARAELRALDGRSRQVRSYLDEPGRGPSGEAGRLNVRF